MTPLLAGLSHRKSAGPSPRLQGVTCRPSRDRVETRFALLTHMKQLVGVISGASLGFLPVSRLWVRAGASL